MAKRLDAPTVRARLARHIHWRLDAERREIVREFQFADFGQAFAFMTQLALVAERRNHHPEWHNVYNRVTVRLTTHDAGGLTALDFFLARAADEAYERFALVPGAARAVD